MGAEGVMTPGRVLGALVVTGIAAAALYVPFVNPMWQPNVRESLAFTNNCIDNSDVLSHDREREQHIAQAVNSDNLLSVKNGHEFATAFFFSSDSDARSAEADLRAGLTGSSGLTRRQKASINRRVVRRRFELLLFGDDRQSAPVAPSRRFAGAVTGCVWAISRPRVGWFDLFDQRELDRPFQAAHWSACCRRLIVWIVRVAVAGAVGCVLALGVALHEWSYHQSHPGRTGVSGVLVVLALAVALASFGVASIGWEEAKREAERRRRIQEAFNRDPHDL
jgi:hypothetical protein